MPWAVSKAVLTYIAFRFISFFPLTLFSCGCQAPSSCPMFVHFCALFAQHPLTDLLTFLMRGAKSSRFKSRYACHRTETVGMAYNIVLRQQQPTILPWTIDNAK